MKKVRLQPLISEKLMLKIRAKAVSMGCKPNDVAVAIISRELGDGCVESIEYADVIELMGRDGE